MSPSCFYFSLYGIFRDMATVLDELRKDKLVKCIVSKHTLPSGVSIQIHDYRSTLFSDDDYYSKTKSLYLRRGVAAIYLDEGDAHMTTPLYVLCGPPKFGYEEDQLTTEPNWSSLRLKRWVFTEKENGEAGHLAFFPIKNQWYAIIGSKNVHIVLTISSLDAARADIASYTGVRTQTAVKNANLMLDACGDVVIPVSKMHRMVYKNNWTLVFEAVFNDHLVQYDKHKVIMFAITCPQLTTVEKQGLTIPPQVSLPILKNWGFDVASHITVPVKNKHQKETVEKKYESKENSEGAVVYGIYETKSGTEIVGKIYKHKNHVYILQRMARELLKRKASPAEWKRRFDEVHFDATSHSRLIKELFIFREWVEQKYNTAEIGWSDIVQHKFMKMWKEFTSIFNTWLSKVGWSDDIQDKFVKTWLGNKHSNDSSNKALMLVGIQGTGKSTLRNALMHVIGTSGAIFINQDEAGGRKEFMKALTEASKTNKLVIVDKINHVHKLREDVYSLFDRVAIAEMQHDADIKDLALTRLRQRGMAHLTLQYSENTENILNSIAAAYEPVSESEKKHHDYIPVNAANTTLRQVKDVVKFLINSNFISGVTVKPTASDINIVTKAYEDAIVRRALSLTRNIKAVVKSDDIHNAVRHLVPVKGPIKWKWDASDTPEYHVTLTYNRNISKSEQNVMLSWPVSFNLFVDGIVYNANCAALRIRKEDLPICDNIHPHITIGCAEGIPPVQAQKVFTDSDAIEIPLKIKIKATISL